ncbi:MAG: hypothetical protein Fur0024_3260 [Patescibacteria group bacterium]
MKNFFPKSKLEWLKFFGLVLIALSILIAFFTRIFLNFFNFQFSHVDAIRDSFVVERMKNGDFPGYGPVTSRSGVFHLPLYYYILFIFSFLGSNPVFQSFPNALFSFFSVSLFGVLIFKILNKENFEKKIFLTGFAMFWWSVFFSDIALSNRNWNPNSIPFFLILFFLIFEQIFFVTKVWQKIFLWSLFGLVLSILVSLHSTTMFTMPIVFAICIFIFLFRGFKRKENFLKNLIFPSLSVVISIISLIPYFILEFKRGFENTREILGLILHGGYANISFIEKLDNISRVILSLSRVEYFVNEYNFNFFGIFIVAIISIFILNIKPNKTFWISILSTFFLYLFASSNWVQEFHRHYKLEIVFMPIIFFVFIISEMDFKKFGNIFISIFLIIGAFFSIKYNIQKDVNYIKNLYGKDRIMVVSDYVEVLKFLPDKSLICSTVNGIGTFDYLNKTIVKKDFRFYPICEKGDYFVYKKIVADEYFYNFQKNPNSKPENFKVIFENEVYIIFQNEGGQKGFWDLQDAEYTKEDTWNLSKPSKFF